MSLELKFKNGLSTKSFINRFNSLEKMVTSNNKSNNG